MIMKDTAKRIALGGVLTALALVLGYLEHLVPFDLGIPGVKLGLSNLVTVTALYLLGWKYALAVNLVRILASSLLFGNALSLTFSLSGGMLSVAVMILIRRLDKRERLGVTGVSLLGGITHNIGQLAVAIITVDNLGVAFYLPVLLAAGAVTGFVIGAVALLVVNNKNLQKAIE